MPDLLNRYQHEEEVAYGFAAVLERQRRELERLGVQKAAEQPDDYWKKHEAEIAAIALLLLRRPWEASASVMSTVTGEVFGSQARHQAYQRWIGRYGGRLAGEIVATNKQVVQSAAAKVSAGEKITPQERALAVLSDQARVTKIAVTETTRAASRGEFAAVDDYNKRSKRLNLPRLLTAVWRTERDGRVCPVCRPLDGKGYASWMRVFRHGPPAHPVCRCWLDWVLQAFRWN